MASPKVQQVLPGPILPTLLVVVDYPDLSVHGRSVCRGLGLCDSDGRSVGHGRHGGRGHHQRRHGHDVVLRGEGEGRGL